MQASYVELRNLLKDLNFPITKQNLIQQAKKHGATCKIIEDLESIPDKDYTSSDSVMEELDHK
jgi:hypothetical protein